MTPIFDTYLTKDAKNVLSCLKLRISSDKYVVKFEDTKKDISK